MKRFACATLLALTFAATTGGQSPRNETPVANSETSVQDLMGVKLVHAKDLLEALALEDFESIARNAQQLELLSRDSGWSVLQTQTYRELSNEFRRASRSLNESARAKNLDGASLAYVQLTLNCVQCHKHVRQERQ